MYAPGSSGSSSGWDHCSWCCGKQKSIRSLPSPVSINSWETLYHCAFFETLWLSFLPFLNCLQLLMDVLPSPGFSCQHLSHHLFPEYTLNETSFIFEWTWAILEWMKVPFLVSHLALFVIKKMMMIMMMDDNNGLCHLFAQTLQHLLGPKIVSSILLSREGSGWSIH